MIKECNKVIRVECFHAVAAASLLFTLDFATRSGPRRIVRSGTELRLALLNGYVVIQIDDNNGQEVLARHL